MNRAVEDNKINNIGEFSEQKLEKEFFSRHIQKAMRYIRPLILFLGLLNTLFLIPDSILIDDPIKIKMVAIGRIVFVLLVVILFFVTKQVEQYEKLALWISLYELLCGLLFLFVFYQYPSPDYLIQAFGVIVILIVLFMVPNRWIYTIVISVAISVGFLVMSAVFLKKIPSEVYWAGAVYIWIVLILCGIASFHSNSIERMQYESKKELIRLSTTDPLSGVYNRVKADSEMIKWMQYSKRYRIPFSIAIIDFDDFKKVNDTYGHLVGDAVISDFAKLVQKCIRKADIFARWGGEEFILLLPNTNIMHAADLTERIRLKIERYPFHIVGKVTCSIGFAQMSCDDEVKSLMGKADRALYSAKKDGKNKVRHF